MGRCMVVVHGWWVGGGVDVMMGLWECMHFKGCITTITTFFLNPYRLLFQFNFIFINFHQSLGARPTLPVRPNPNPAPPNLGVLGLHFTAAAQATHKGQSYVILFLLCFECSLRWSPDFLFK